MIKVIHFGSYSGGVTAISTDSHVYVHPFEGFRQSSRVNSKFEYISKVLSLYENEGWQVIATSEADFNWFTVTLRK